MKRLLRLALPFSLLTLMLLALGYWNLRPDRLFEEARTSAAIEPEIDYYVENSTTLQFMPDGGLHYRLQAPRVDHYRQSRNSELTSPRMQLYRGNQLPWNIQSDRAKVLSDGSRILMTSNVRVARTDTSNRNTILTTNFLVVYPGREYAETNNPVRIEAANGVTTAKGMQAYLKEGRMLLKSQVRGQHEIR